MLLLNYAFLLFYSVTFFLIPSYAVSKLHSWADVANHFIRQRFLGVYFSSKYTIPTQTDKIKHQKYIVCIVQHKGGSEMLEALFW